MAGSSGDCNSREGFSQERKEASRQEVKKTEQSRTTIRRSSGYFYENIIKNNVTNINILFDLCYSAVCYYHNQEICGGCKKRVSALSGTFDYEPL
ncbi:MAG: hypothetical protein II922_09765 [Succinimonas sp.]|nr:hypothetical protein [Succinimonas sp.]